MEKIKVLIVEDIVETRELVAKMLNLQYKKFDVVGEVGNGADAIRFIEEYPVDVALVDINMPIMNGLQATEIITEKFPHVSVVIMSVQGDSEYLKQAMSAGAKGYIIKPINHEELDKTIVSTHQKNKSFQDKIIVPENTKKDGTTISFYSLKGGVGKSVLSINSAINMSMEANKKVLLIDVDLYYGDISILCNGHTEDTVFEIVENYRDMDYENVKKRLHQHNDNLDILFAPNNPENAEAISVEKLAEVYTILKPHYDYIFIDTGVNFDEVTIKMLDFSKYIMLVSSMEITSLKNTKAGLKILKSFNYDKEKIKIIINEANNKFGISKNGVNKTFDDNIFAYIPEDVKNVRTAVNTGKPICDDKKYRNTKFTQAVKEINKKILNI